MFHFSARPQGSEQELLVWSQSSALAWWGGDALLGVFRLYKSHS